MFSALCTAPATFKCLMESALWGLTYEVCWSPWMVTVSQTFQKKPGNLRKVFQRFWRSTSQTEARKVKTIPEWGAASGTHITRRCDYRTEGCIGMATAKRQPWVVEVPWSPYLLPAIHSQIPRHHQATDRH
jgi:hypothetical protein